jgi:hypothetical protein
LQAWRRDPDVRERACVDNIWFEERVGANRLAAYEAELAAATTSRALRDGHSRYWKTFVVTDDVPHSFMDDMEPADLGSATLDEYQRIVRVESLDRPLKSWGGDFEALQNALVNRDTALLQGFLDVWNEARDHRPAFAAWRDEVVAETEADDWADRLRNRMGLAHFRAAMEPLPVALMEYTVRDVKAEAAVVSAMFTSPTVLDTEPWPQFFPAPRDIPYGRAMALAPIGDENQLLAEMLHTRLTYKPHHIRKLGLIAAPYREHDLRELRNTHLLALRIASGRDDFGEEIP